MSKRVKRLNREHTSATERPRERTYLDSRAREELSYAATIGAAYLGIFWLVLRAGRNAIKGR